MTELTIRQLVSGDEPMLEAFLATHPDTSMFLRSNLRDAGIVYHGLEYQGVYTGAFDASGTLIGVFAHFCNGNIMTQAPEPNVLTTLVDHFKESRSQSFDGQIGGFVGDSAQLKHVMERFNLTDADYSTFEDEDLYSLDLSDLRMPPPFDGLSNPHTWQARPIEERDRALLIPWAKGYLMEALGRDDSVETDQLSADQVENWLKTGRRWVLEVDGATVALTGFNAVVPDCVQVGGVWTPPELRGKGYARALVAASLADAESKGADRAILFTSNPQAAKAYTAIGFEKIGRFMLAWLKAPVRL